MLNIIVAQFGGNNLSDSVYGRIVLAIIVFYVLFFIHLYIFRAIFNIPRFLRYQKAQIRLLEELAKTQGVEASKVQSIISETHGWNDVPTQSIPSNHGHGQ